MESACKIHSLYILLIILMTGSSCLERYNTSFSMQPTPSWTSLDTTQILKLTRKAIPLIYSNPDSAMGILIKANNQSRKSGYNDGVGYTLAFMGFAATKQGKYQEGFTHYRDALPYCKNAKQMPNLPAFLNINMGTSYLQKGDYALASHHYHDALQHLLSRNPNDPNVASVYSNMSVVQLRLGQYPKALNYAIKAEELARNNRVTLELVGALINKSDALMHMNKTDEAFEALQEALAISRKKNFIDATQSILCGLGDIMLKQYKYENAIAYFNEAISLGYSTGAYYSLILPQYGLGMAYYKMDQLEKAEQYLTAALKEARKTELMENSHDAYAILAHIYRTKGQYDKAFDYQQKYIELKDSALGREKSNAINELEIKYRTVEKDRNLAQKELLINKQKTQLSQRNLWIGGISAAAILLIVLLISRIRINRQKQENQSKQIRILRQQKDIYMHEQQIEHLNAMMQGEERERIRIARELHDGIVSQLLAVRLHFNSILQKKTGSILYQEDFNQTIQHLDTATRELRTTAHNLMPETVLQNGLIIALQTYCSTMSELTKINIRFQQIGKEFSLDPERALCIYRIVQELIQNALKHAKASRILVQLNYHQSNMLFLTVEDNGIGCKEEVLNSKNSMGFKNILARVTSLKGNVDFSSKEGEGTAIHMEFDWESN